MPAPRGVSCPSQLASTWNVGPALMRGDLVPVLGQFMVPDMSVYAVYPPGRFTQPKVRAFIDFLVSAFAESESVAA